VRARGRGRLEDEVEELVAEEGRNGDESATRPLDDAKVRAELGGVGLQ